MQLDCTPKPKNPKKDKSKWHPRFILFPHRMEFKSNCTIYDCRWLETVMRRRVIRNTLYGSYYRWEYAAIIPYEKKS